MEAIRSLLPIVLPAYAVAYFLLVFVLRSWLHKRKTGVNPYVLGKSDSPHDYVGRWFRFVSLLAFVPVMLFSFGGEMYQYMAPIWFMASDSLTLSGLAALAAAFIWIAVAQAHMHASWRIGIDFKVKTPLVSTGLFAVSRNPIFLGMIATLAGLFLVLPSAVTLLVFVLGLALTQIQVRLEEEFLRKSHGAEYESYCKKVRRWL